MVPSARPASVRRAVSLMYAGAALSLAYGLVDGFVAHSATLSSSTSSPYTTGVIFGAVVEGLAQVGLWLWMAWKTGTGRGWARVLSTVFFGLLCVQLVVSLSVAVVAGKGAPAVAVFIVVLAEWGVGLNALIQLWRRESSEFFAFAKRAELAAVYGPAYGYQPPGYGQAPQYGQPQYGQPQYGQPRSGQSPPPGQEPRP
jgi:hypothetical protein